MPHPLLDPLLSPESVASSPFMYCVIMLLMLCYWGSLESLAKLGNWPRGKASRLKLYRGEEIKNISSP